MINTKQFTYDVQQKGFYAEASTCGYKGGQTVQLVSEKTGKTSEWKMQRVQKDREMEIQAWHFAPTVITLREHPGLQGHTMTIYND